MEKKLKRWKIATIVLAITTVVFAVMLAQSNIFGSADKAAAKAVDYINKYSKYLLPSDATATLSSVDKETIVSLRKITLDVSGTKFASYVSVDGKYLFAQEPIDLSKDLDSSDSSSVQSAGTEIEGGFSEAKDTEVCKENDKPIVYFFGSTTCPHCTWEKPILQSVVSQFGDAISYHENIDTDKDQDIFSKYSTGSIPTLVIGCKYYRVGSGEPAGEASEKESLKKVICRATGNLPASVCGE
ncbi:thioredoxin family protein [bacterium]|jgi:thiol-disulfide isomerase/thioredoxin|nr:thioredoxin family protein [bacterium]